MRALVVIPTYNEAENAPILIREILARDASVGLLIVDDNSPDGTAGVVEQAMADEPRLFLHRRPGKLGLGSAYLAGFRFGLERGYEAIVTMDGDLSHNPRYVSDLLGAVGEYDMVIGSRYRPGGHIIDWPIHRRALSAFANAYTRTLLRLPVRDCTSGYRCYTREVLETVEPFDIQFSGYSFLEEMVWRVHRAGFRIGEVPIVFETRHAGISKIDRSEIYRAAWHVLATAVFPPVVPIRRPVSELRRQDGEETALGDSPT
jgi:glycosyltransferase involved in cell wall biosynthesis